LASRAGCTQEIIPSIIVADKASISPVTKKEVAATQVKTTEWDMAFGGTLTCFISGNNGADAANYGVESNAIVVLQSLKNLLIR
jgi:hypothetical protein